MSGEVRHLGDQFCLRVGRVFVAPSRAKTPVRTEIQDRATPPARRAPVEVLGLAELSLRVLRRSEVRERVRGWC